MTIALMFSLNNTHFCTGCLLQIPEVYYNDLGKHLMFIKTLDGFQEDTTYISLFQRVWFNLKCETCNPFAVRHSFRSIWWTWLQHLCVWHKHICFQLRCLQKTNNQCKHAIVNLHENSRCEIISSLSQMSWTVLNVCFTSNESASEYKPSVKSILYSWEYDDYKLKHKHKDMSITGSQTQWFYWSKKLDIKWRERAALWAINSHELEIKQESITTESNSKQCIDQHKCITSPQTWRFWKYPIFPCFTWWWNTCWLIWRTRCL